MPRKFNFADELLLQYGSTLVGHLTKDLPLFKSFDSDLNESKVKQLNTWIDAALKEGGDDHNRAELRETTEKVILQMRNSRLLFNELRYWVLKAFPNKTAIRSQFGIGRLTKAAKKQPLMIEFMYEIAESAARYKSELSAVNIDKQLLEQIARQPKILQDANTVQEQKKASRGVDAEKRITRLNMIFEYLQAFHNAAAFVFINKPAKRKLYRVPST